jgi:succinyl-CoA synthetase beta subunit
LQAAATAVPEVPRAATRLTGPIHEAAAKALLAEAGVPVLPERVCTTAEEAVQAAAMLGYPLVMKILSQDIPHKTEMGGVLLNLGTAEAVAEGFAELMWRARLHKPQARLEGILLSPMVSGGVETIIGVQRDRVFGPMVMFGLGGTSAELFNDVAFASAPLTLERAEALVASVRGARLLEGWRGAAALDRAALVAALCAISRFAVAHWEEVTGVEVNPFLVQAKGGQALDALIALEGDQTPH